ncbi:hypothetical protein EJ08DRAFT_655702 [Tothia fuscella]|uniref:Uncharacterized protein n=1 Tax=Tothia fuscella TaxID=1048955 RepID=A0A9P4P3N6_9PEZI|nr:hypothetical protein EJ08DRAFT_655702 [Tothia fuscella]
MPGNLLESKFAVRELTTSSHETMTGVFDANPVSQDSRYDQIPPNTPTCLQNSSLRLTSRGVWVGNSFFLAASITDLIELSYRIRNGQDATKQLFSIHVFNLKFTPTTTNALHNTWTEFMQKIGAENMHLIRKARLASSVDRQKRYRSIRIDFGATSTYPMAEVQIRFHDEKDKSCGSHGLDAPDGKEEDRVTRTAGSTERSLVKHSAMYEVTMKRVHVLEVLGVLGRACLGHKLSCPNCMFLDMVRWYEEGREVLK